MGGPVKLMIRWFSGPVESFREFRAPRIYGDGFLFVSRSSNQICSFVIRNWTTCSLTRRLTYLLNCCPISLKLVSVNVSPSLRDKYWSNCARHVARNDDNDTNYYSIEVLSVWVNTYGACYPLFSSVSEFKFNAALRPQTTRTIRDGGPRTSTSTFTQLLSSESASVSDTRLARSAHS